MSRLSSVLSRSRLRHVTASMAFDLRRLASSRRAGTAVSSRVRTRCLRDSCRRIDCACLRPNHRSGPRGYGIASVPNASHSQPARRKHNFSFPRAQPRPLRSKLLGAYVERRILRLPGHFYQTIINNFTIKNGGHIRIITTRSRRTTAGRLTNHMELKD